jgi:hypothetical protein
LLELPTAMQLVVVGQETPSMSMKVPPAGLHGCFKIV